MLNAKLISEHFVRPKIEVDESKRIRHSSPRDLQLLLVDYIQFGFLYTKPSTFDASSTLQKLTVSLSEALVHYYPLAGQLETVLNQADPSCVIYIDCFKGPGAKITHASAQNLTMLQILNPKDFEISSAVESLFDMGKVTINHDGHTIPLLSVQLTVLHDGVFMSVCCNHSVVDASTMIHFLRVWGNIYLGTFSSSIPLPIVKQPDFLQGRVFKLPSEFVTRPVLMQGHVKKILFKFSPRSLKKIKQIANSVPKTRPISTFFALMAFVWRCITRARNLSPNEITTCVFFVDCRSLLNPSVTKDYFGNYSFKASGCAKVCDLLGNDISWAATLFNNAAAAQDEKAAHALVLEALAEGVAPPVQSSRSVNVVVGGYTKFDPNDANFKLGRLVGFRTGNANMMEGKLSVCMGFDGDDSVEMEASLAPDTVSALLLDQEFMSFATQHDGSVNLVSKI